MWAIFRGVGAASSARLALRAELLQLDGVKHRPFSRLPAIEIGAGELRVLKSGQSIGEFRAMVAPLEVDRLMEEDIVEGIFRGELEAVRNTDSTVDAGAGAPTFTHRAPGHACWAGGNFRGELA